MRKIAFSTIIMILLLAFCSCANVKTTGSGKVPPGQMKKITGSQSAKPYAPGQQNK